MKKNLTYLALFFAFFGILISALLVQYHNNPNFDSAFVQTVCGTDSDSGCSVVNKSTASEFAGLPLSLWGFMLYLLILFSLIYYLVTKETTFIVSVLWLSALAFIIDIFLFIYMIARLGTLCNLCLLTYLSTAGILIFSYLEIKKLQKENKISLIPSFSNLKSLSIPISYTILLSFVFIPVMGGWIYSMSKTAPSDESKESISNDPYKLISKAWEIFYKNFQKETAANLDDSEAPKKGGANPAIFVSEFADYMCPHCKYVGGMLKEVVNKHDENISVAYRHFPLDMECNPSIKRQLHQGACQLSYASVCAQKQGKFWDMHDLIYIKQDEWLKKGVRKEDLSDMAKAIRLNMNQFDACMAGDEPKKIVSKDITEALKLNITGTPAVYINGKKTAIPVGFFLEELVKAEFLRKKGKPSLP
ncbi:MAG: thioredoxin domain-containing protein [Spirochaetia bacterium]|nr:thioredoxin domain-containing protein [Spirochaetia bacterium]